jgi:hypothetical protein
MGWTRRKLWHTPCSSAPTLLLLLLLYDSLLLLLLLLYDGLLLLFQLLQHALVLVVCQPGADAHVLVVAEHDLDAVAPLAAVAQARVSLKLCWGPGQQRTCSSVDVKVAGASSIQCWSPELYDIHARLPYSSSSVDVKVMKTH